MVTARKYRPQRFADLVAQGHVAQALMNALKLERIAHAYLFTGPRGVGKTTAARILAKAINCTGNENGEVEPCLTCPSCDDFETQRSLSIFEIDAASNNKVEDIRELRDNVRIPPQGGRRKVYIVDEVHMLSNAAFNALLKTLEEPPPHVLFIFATTEPHKVLPTILSRCQRFDFRRIPSGEIVTHLIEICDKEKITADEDALHLIADKGDGAMRDALSVFDQAVALCGSELKYSTLTDALRVVDADLYFEATRHIAERATGPILSLAEKVISDGYDIREFLNGLAEHVRHLLVTTTLGPTALVDVSKSLRERYTKAATLFSETTLLRLLMVMDETQARLPASSSPRLTVELALIKMTHMSESSDLSEALEQIRRIEQTMNGNSQQQMRRSQEPVNQVPPGQTSPSPVHHPPSQDIPVHPATTQQPPRQKTRTASLAFGQPALNPTNSTEQTSLPKQNQTSQNPGKESANPKGTLQETWEHVQKIIGQNPDVQGSSTLKNSIAIEIHNQSLEVAVPNEVVIMVAQNPALKNLIKSTMQSFPQFSNVDVKFVVRPDLFPVVEVDWDAEFQKLKEKIPALKLLDSAFGLKLVNSP